MARLKSVLFFFIFLTTVRLFSFPGSTNCLATAQGTVFDSATGLAVPCADGTYYNGSACLDCDPGFSCLGSNASPQACANNTYQNEAGQTACLPCPAGKSCLNVAADPVECGAGQYSPVSDSVCHACDSGLYSDHGASHCLQCPAGFSCTTSSKTECLAGTYSTLGAGICTSCDNGTHTNGTAGAAFCSQCPAGYKCEDPTSAPVPCSDGEYSTVGDARCFSCPAGFYCPDPAGSPKSCPLGQYSTGGAGSAGCAQCPAGMSCIDFKSSEACLEGTYSIEGEAVCTDCPAGSSCADATLSPVSCASGEYSSAGNGTCYPCPVGYICVDPSNAPLKCPSGTTTNGMTGQTFCSVCPAGQSCTDPAAAPSICPTGSYVPSGVSECESCPAGAKCSGSTAEACTPGTYSLLGESNCTDCPAGLACPYTNQAVEVPCEPGSYSIGGQSYCTRCPVGSECPDVDKATVTPCNPGYYSVGFQNTCTDCPAGKACPDPDGSGNIDCIAGTYSSAHATSCTACPAGSACPFTNNNTTITCGDGYFSGLGQATCTPCAAGYYCDTSDAADGGATACDSGSYSIGRQASCTDCQPGYACPTIFTAIVIPCPEGTYSEAKKMACTSCPAGEECPVTTSKGTTCPDGRYSLGRQTECTICPAGYQCSTKDSAPIICLSGEYSSSESTSCIPCDAGYVCSGGSTVPRPPNDICPLGSYCTAGTDAVIPCPAGSYGSREGLESDGDCAKCTPGYYCLEGTAGVPRANNLCPKGYFCPESTERNNENPCLAGTYGPDAGMETEAAACKSCPEGRYCTQGSSTPGVPCPRGHHCEAETGDEGNGDGAKEPVPCMAGTYTAEEGARTIASCVDCPAGYYCTSGTANPSSCPPGTFQPDVQKPSADNCLPCTAGMACTVAALTQPDSSCSPGYYCPVGSSLPNNDSHACPAGTYTDEYNITSSDQCDICPVRYACYEATGGTNRKPVQCAPGYFCPNGTEFTTQHPCPAGSYSNRSNLASWEECWQCPRGFFCLDGSSDISNNTCPAGYYCPAGTQYAKQYPCSSGSYSNMTGNVRWEDCDDCIEGHYCTAGLEAPIACPPGTFNDASGSKASDACASCDAGYYCPDNGTITPVPCGKGMYSGFGLSECLICPAGYYCDDDTTTNAVLQNKTCPEGMHCDNGTVQAPDLFDFSCPAGFYCLRGSTEPYPQPCPVGTYSDKTGLKTSAECTPCTEGFYCDVTNLTAPAGDCPPGYYCITGTGDSNSHPCSRGTFLNGSSAISSDSCTTCTSGYYCPDMGTSEPIPCPKGHYCEPGQSNPANCPAGTYSNRTLVKSALECTPCPGGSYCEGVGNEVPTGFCKEGYYCESGAWVATPNDGETGDVCPAGGYCPQGSPSPQTCPPGKYSVFKMAISEDNCTDCPEGKFCSGLSSTGYTGNCSAGYYCTGGASTSTQNHAEPGYYAEVGAFDQTECPKGTYSSGSNSPSCTVCEAGQYCNETAMSATLQCPRGYYCPRQTISPKPCPPGKFNDELGQLDESACNLCNEGYFCSESGLPESEGQCAPGFWCGTGSTTSTPDGTQTEFEGGPCPQGFYCESGTADPAQCKPGTYNNATHGKNESYCLECPPGRSCSEFNLAEPNGYCTAGYYCSGGAEQSTPPEDTAVPWGAACEPGYYCPTGSPSQRLCEPGTYNTEEKASSCHNCPEGYQCRGGQDRILCPIGFYCPNGTGLFPRSCPPGTYRASVGAATIDDCTPCDAGKYCDELNQTSSTKDCDPGYFCRSGVNVSNPTTTPSTGDGGVCPPGNYCPRGTGEPEGCDVGKYSDQMGLQAADECLDCEPGKFCSTTGLTAPDGNCTAGYFCSGGSSTSTPTGTGGDLCSSGFYCPEGTPAELRCPAGGYSNSTGLAECTPCEPGFYCPAETVDYTRNPCVPGYYCPAGSSTYVPCPPGSYGTAPQLSSAESCLPCDPGKYCLESGNTTVSGDCDPGFYCLTNSSSPRPSGFATYSSTTMSSTESCLCPASDIGGECPLGHYCPSGTGQPLPCSNGSYCEIIGLSTPSGPCSAGYYCNSSATRPDPEDGVTGGFCPRGYWCGEGTGNPTPCPAGTFGAGEGLESEANCTKCTPGFYCEDPAQTGVTEECNAGFFCPEGSSVGNNMQCEAGYQCPVGSPDQVLCDSGYYQNEVQQASCKICPAGFYCDINDGPIPDYTLYECPLGSYCINGTKYSTEYLCPVGTYGAATQRESADDCVPCEVGKYCPREGLTPGILSDSSYDCAAGYFCISGANISTPEDGITGRPCSKGHYCPAGTTDEKNCKSGTFNNQTGQGFSAACVDCTPGYYCDAPALEEPAGPCLAGYYCPGGDTSATPVDQNCTVGHFCPQQTANPIPCYDGTYNLDRMATECLNCTAGRYCVDGETQVECPQGFYCPSGTGYNWMSCPTGRYGQAGGLESEDDCRLCDPGKYCEELNATTFTGNCDERFFCRNGSSSPNPDGSDGVNGPCSPGHYCPRGTFFEINCPAGTFSDKYSLAYENECTPCPPGQYCEGGGLSAPSGNCSAGYVCKGNATNAMNPVTDETGGPCPTGFWCPEGTANPRACPAGTYNNLDGQAECFTCPAGFYCPENSTDYSSFICPRGSYCPNGTGNALSCPAGTFNNATQQEDLRGCQPCTPGYFCESSGLFEPTNKCAAGWYCSLCSLSAKPGDPYNGTVVDTTCLCPVQSDVNSTGGQCQPGSFCPEGSNEPIPCTAGYSCETSGLSSETGVCDAGFYCLGGASTRTPTDGTTGDECPMGHYCEAGSPDKTPCSPGTFTNLTRRQSQDECSICTAGYYCSGGESAESGFCEAGYYCPAGQNISRPTGFECPTGNKCSTGVGEPEPCESGTYQSEVGKAFCDECPAGYYCEAINTTGTVIGVTTPSSCLRGYFCPNGTKTSTQYGCPLGTYGDRGSLTDRSLCKDCDGGSYCDTTGASEPTGSCLAGFFCTLGASFNAPTDNITGGICPVGKFCPNNTQVPEPCPAGTFGPTEGLQSSDNCTQCTGGMYCEFQGQSEPTANCSGGYYCPTGSQTATEEECPVGYHCPVGSPNPVPCPVGSYTNAKQQATCQLCEEGSFCNGTEIMDCPQGYYCPNGTGIDIQPCPRGTYGDTTNLQSEDQCKQCDAGYYCPDLHASSYAGQCSAGYFCRSGSDSQTPTGDNTGDAGVCPMGYYCPEGTGEPKGCLAGTFNDELQATGPEFCTNCTSAHYCNTSGLAEPTGLCFEGYYCTGGASNPAPSVVTDTGGPCPTGSFCELGSSAPRLCLGGSYAPDFAMSACLICPAGQYCPVGANSMTTCPVGHYCVENSTMATACNNGTYNNETGAPNKDSCQFCPGGYFCPDRGMENPKGKCAPGWYCVLGSWMERPNVIGNYSDDCACPADGGIGGQCQPGHYCPEGSTLPTPCDGGYYCDAPGLSDVTGPCQAGFYCSGSSLEEEPVGKSYGNVCQPGFYCPVNSSSEKPCPIGYFANRTRSTSLADCEECTGGWYCPTAGLPTPQGTCETGYFCPPRSTEKSPSSNRCPVGTECPSGSSSFTPCYSGTYQPDTGKGSCLICPEGYYCDYSEAVAAGLDGVVTQQICPQGFYCPPGTNFSTEHPCPIGRYGDSPNLGKEIDCKPCDAGFFCDQTNQTSPTDECFPGYYCSVGSSSPTNQECPQGSYCPSGSSSPTDCPPGTYGDGPMLSSRSQCSPCDPGYYCDVAGLTSPKGGCLEGYYCSINSSEPNPVGQIYGDVCPPGAYCPFNSSQPTLCPIGTYNPESEKSSLSDCLGCTPGKFCNGTGQSAISGECWERYYCDFGASVPTQHDCPPGFYCLVGSPAPRPCENGTYANTSNADVCTACPRGWYCPDQTADPLPCPAGHFCPDETGWNWGNCPPGTFGPSEGLKDASECTPCTAGSYCDVPGQSRVSGQCTPGYNCIVGVDSQSPDNTTNTGSGGLCMLGHQCPNGSAESCPPGTFANVEGLPSCRECLEGSYCDGGTINPLPCPAGHYCPRGTKFDKQYFCEAGKFNNMTGQSDESSCQLCTGGMYCPGTGNEEPYDYCDEGYYCVAGSSSAKPFVTGLTMGGSVGNCSTLFDCVCPVLPDTIGGVCTPGYYCPRGSDKPRACTDGMYCPDYEMHEPLADCSAGYFCVNGSAVSDQNECPPGYYCEAGTGVPSPCPDGTYSSTTKNLDVSYCQRCTPGMYCEGNHNEMPTGNCSAGYYCPGGDSSQYSKICSAHHRCPTGSINQTVCDAGTYQPETGKAVCEICPVEFICSPDEGVTLDKEACPAGHYCPRGTPKAQPCPVGTYLNLTGGGSESDCRDCPGGEFCDLPGLVEPSGNCFAGYYCSGRSGSSQPSDVNVTETATGLFTGNSVCPAGYYCPNSTTNPEPCRAGSFSNDTRLSDSSQCLLCPAGKYCSSDGMSDGDAAPDCAAGYVCVGGAVSPTPDDATGYPCPKGYYCPSGTTVPLGCPPGSYGPDLGADSCVPCPAGSVCSSANMTSVEPCWQGYYCPINTSSPEPCPESTYNNQYNAKDESRCISCPSGFFCNGTGNAEPTGPCSAGYLCERGSSTPTPSGSSSTISPYNGPCPVGKWCGVGATDSVNCPSGTMRNSTGAASEAECNPCDPGFYCLYEGQSSPTGPCRCGSYCPGNDSNTSPTQYPCPIGNYCPEQSAKPVPCPAGQYQGDQSECSCDSCPPGYYCQDSLNGGQTPCPAYNYCPAGVSHPILCPNGTYTLNTTDRLESPEECLPCPVGKYCTGGQIKGDCSAGFFCASRSYSPTADESLDPCPSGATCAGPCPAGFYCRVGEVDPQPCPDNTIRVNPGASKVEDCLHCPAGLWCHTGNPVPDLCPAGYFCSGLNTSDCTMDAGPQPCPLYTYRNSTGGVKSDDCIPCPPGFSCNETGLSDYQYSACEPGYFCNSSGGQPPIKCPAGTLRSTPGGGSVDDCSPCTAGYYCPDPALTGVTNIFGIPCEAGYNCPAGSVGQSLCPGGYFCLEKTSSPEICPGGYYCPRGSSLTTLCDYPLYCPEGTESPLPCDVGYQPLNISGLRDVLTESCMICPVGSYRNSSTDDKCLSCPPGYFCPEGTGNYQQNPCPVGHYCPEGGITATGGVTGQPIACPAGTFGQQSGSVFSVCQDCAAGMYNNKEGQPSCFPCGSSASSSSGSTECTCDGFNRAFQSSDGSCVCKSGYIYYNEENQAQAEGNSGFSCEAIVDDRCSSDQTRIASDRSCATASAYSCESTCGSRGGSMNVDLGKCLCDTVTVPEEIPCAVGCNTVSTTLDSTTGSLTITTTSTVDGSVSKVTVPNLYGPADRTVASANTMLIQLVPQGVFGVPVTSTDTMSDFVNGSFQDTIAASYDVVTSRKKRSLFFDLEDDGLTVSRYFGRKILQTISDNSTTTTTPTIIADVISNPVICLQMGEILLFNIYRNPVNRSLSNYPVYVRDHLYNTNPNFDYGAFRQLQTYVTQSNWPVTNFAHVFLEPGIYVFADAQNPGQEIIVNCLANGLVCDESRMQPATESSLTQLGVAKQSVTNLTPDWVLIAVLLALFGLCVVVLVIAVMIWRPRDAGIYPMRYWKPRYRALGEPYVPPYKQLSTTSIETREGLGLIRERGEAEGAEADVLKDEQLLEDFNVRTLYDKLEDQNLHLSSQMTKHQNSLRGFYEKISNQTEGLKKMLKKLDVSKLEAAELARSSTQQGASASVVHTTLNMNGREFKLAGGSSLREKELLQSLEVLIKKLNTGKITVSDEVLNDARKRLQGLEGKDAAMQADATRKKAKIEDWKSHGQAELIKAQESDKIDLERELIAGEREAITNLLITHDNQRKKLIGDLDDNLAFKMQGELSEKEMDALLSEHEKELENALGALSKERMRQMKELQEQLESRRKAKAEQLRQAHAEQCKEAGIPGLSDGGDDDKSSDLSLLEKQLEAALLQESAASSKEEAEVAGGSMKEDGAKLTKTFADELDAMVANGLISAEVRDQLTKQLYEQENDLNSKIEQKREMQVRTMKERMAERKRRKMKKLKEQQEEEKNLAGGATLEMEEKHTAEIEALEAELDAEAAALEKDLSEALHSEYEEAVKELHKNIINQMGVKHDVDPVTQQELLDRYRREIDNFDHVNNMKKSQQAQDVKVKLAAKRARRAADVQKSAEEKLREVARDEEARRLEELSKLQDARDTINLQETDGLDIPDVLFTENLEVQALVREHEKLLAETDTQQAVELDNLMQDLDKKEKDDQEALEKKLREEKERAMRETTSKHEAEGRARSGLSEEQAQQLLSAHQQELDDLEENLEKQQNRQRAALREKMAARRKRKAALLRHRQEIEKQREQVEQRKEMAQVQVKTAKDAERVAIIEGIEKHGASSSERVIQKVLEKRQAQELKNLEEEFALKKKMLIDEALRLIGEQYQNERETLLSKHEAELLKLENERLPAEEFAKRKEELLKLQQDQLKELDRNHERTCKDIEESTTAQWKLDYAQAKLKLKEKHYQEFAEALRELAPSGSQQRSAEEAELSAKRLEETKDRLEQERSVAEKELARERQDLEEEEKRRIAAAMEEFGKELETETVQDKMKAEKSLNNLAQRKEKLLKDKRDKIREEIERAASAGASEEEQKKILEQHEKDVENLTNKMDRERLRMKTQLEERLKKRRKEKIKAKQQELEKESQKNREEIDAKQKAEMQKVHEEQIKEMQKTAEIMEENAKSRAIAEELPRVQTKKEVPLKAPESVPPPLSVVQEDFAPMQFDATMAMVPLVAAAPSISEKDLHKMLMTSPLYQTLQEVRGVLNDEKKSETLGADAKFIGPDVNSRDKELIPTPLSELNVRELVAYKFGTFILGLLRTRRTSYPLINLLVAEKVPSHPELKGNAFRGSFSFDEGNGILYIKRDRLTQDSVGRLSLLLVHVAAHVATRSLHDDSSSSFVQEFYQCLAVLSDDLFFARYKASPDNGKQQEKADGKPVGLSQDLLDIKLPERDVTTPHTSSGDAFRQRGLDERIDKYSHTVVSSIVRDELGNIESKFNQARSSGTLDKIDNKLTSLLPQKPSTSHSSRSRPSTSDYPRPTTSTNEDYLNSEFLALTQEANQLETSLSSGDLGDEVTVRNRLTNVKARLSDVQKRIRSTH
ncbi:unnamed protein product [Clavelina lepadiformis]|uniref:Chitin-binding type-2 domain-containing protein n=1 Tax=Clavelina lepadiformis TaxID=159417 RepID=A0ABP0FDF6_CLALP